MTKSKLDELKKEFPEFYSRIPIGFGIECGEGWYDLLRDLSIKIRDWLKAHPDDGVSIDQVKEKYGQLRFYYTATEGLDEHITKWVEEAENLSAKTCEDCGNPGEQHNLGWVYTRCPICIEQIKRRWE